VVLIATIDIPEVPLNIDPVDWVGVDRGIVNLATTSDGDDGPADVVAGINVRNRARSAWVFVNMPNPAPA
jgi:transposase